MDEKEYIYKQLKYLIDENHRLNEIVDDIVRNQETVFRSIEKLTTIVNQIADPQYIKKINQINEYEDIMKKVNFIRNYSK